MDFEKYCINLQKLRKYKTELLLFYQQKFQSLHFALFFFTEYEATDKTAHNPASEQFTHQTSTTRRSPNKLTHVRNMYSV